MSSLSSVNLDKEINSSLPSLSCLCLRNKMTVISQQSIKTSLYGPLLSADSLESRETARAPSWESLDEHRTQYTL